VVKSDIANTTVLSSAISLLVLSVEFAEMLVIWPEIVPIAKEVPIGVITVLAALVVGSVLSRVEMLSIARWRLVPFLDLLMEKTEY
jgi:hypothetical protein